MSVENKVILVTGANRGIGETLVRDFLAAGAAKVYLAVRKPDSTQHLQKDFGKKVETLFADLSEPQSIKTLAEKAADVDIVINNAGVLTMTSPLAPEAEENFRWELEVNVFGLLRMAQAFTAVLEKNRGTFVQINSVASLINSEQLSTYSASKAASYSFTMALRDAFSERNIHVMSVHPGPILSDMSAATGMTDIAEPASVVSNAILNGLEQKAFLVFPDCLAKEFGAAYKPYADKYFSDEL